MHVRHTPAAGAMSADTGPSMTYVPATERVHARRLARRRRAVALGTAGLAIVLAPAAQAATTVVASAGTLAVAAAPGKKNGITVDQPGPILVKDAGDTVSAGSGCTPVNANTVSCPAAGIERVAVNSRDLDDQIVYGAHVGGALQGDTGNDVIRLLGSAPSSSLNGSAGNDSLSGAAGNDAFDGGDGSDTFTGGTGIDSVSYRARAIPVVVDIDGNPDDGAAGERDNVRTDIENLFGGSGSDVLTGSNDANRIFGGDGDDILHGLGGDDVLEPQLGDDNLNGDAGNDIASYAPAVDGRDRFSGGPGRDLASYRLHTSPVNVSLDNVPNDGTPGENDNNLDDVEDVQGTAGNDTLTAHSTVSNRLFGLGGADVLNVVDSISANDLADGGDGIDRCIADADDLRPNCES